MWTVYILQSETTSGFYVGITQDIEQRLDYHNRGLSRWTRGKGPWKLIYTEACKSRSEAARRERQIKSWKSAVAIRKLVGCPE